MICCSICQHRGLSAVFQTGTMISGAKRGILEINSKACGRSRCRARMGIAFKTCGEPTLPENRRNHL